MDFGEPAFGLLPRCVDPAEVGLKSGSLSITIILGEVEHQKQGGKIVPAAVLPVFRRELTRGVGDHEGRRTIACLQNLPESLFTLVETENPVLVRHRSEVFGESLNEPKGKQREQIMHRLVCNFVDESRGEVRRRFGIEREPELPRPGHVGALHFLGVEVLHGTPEGLLKPGPIQDSHREMFQRLRRGRIERQGETPDHGIRVLKDQRGFLHEGIVSVRSENLEIGASKNGWPSCETEPSARLDLAGPRLDLQINHEVLKPLNEFELDRLKFAGFNHIELSFVVFEPGFFVVPEIEVRGNRLAVLQLPVTRFGNGGEQ